MRFIDEAKIKVTAGHGGPGCVSFRRETFMPRGGPDGGDGGDGGDVTFIACKRMTSLQDFRFKRSYQAQNGQPGSGTNKAGRDGESIEVKIPVGTIIKDAETGEVLIDFKEDGERWIACEGGRGGKGNAHFTTSVHQAPRFAQPGEEGSHRELLLELKLLADVGIIGFPNAGKSTLISRISAARPKIADYPFTTLTPNLGVVSMPDLQSFVVADIPGLIEGAHRGLGLGTKFLKHIERCYLFLHVLDGAKLLEDATLPVDNSFEQAVESVVERYKAIRTELGLFNEALLHKPEIVVLNKVDLVESDPKLVEDACKALKERIAALRGEYPLPNEPFVISAVSGQGIEELLYAAYSVIKERRAYEAGKRENRIQLPDDEGIRH